MATKSKTAIATKQSTAVATRDYSDEVAAIAKRLQASTSGDRIRTSNEKIFTLPDKTELQTLDCIVVDFIAFNRYYKDPYDEDRITPPECFALGLEPTALIPSDNSPDKQSSACAGCWANQFKSAPNKKGKACANTRLLGILIPPAGGFGVNEEISDLPLYTISASPTAIQAFDEHVGKVARVLKAPIRTIITRISFAADSKYPSLRFAIVAPAGPELENYAQSRLQEVRDRLATEPDVSGAAEAEEAPAAPVRQTKKAAVRR